MYHINSLSLVGCIALGAAAPLNAQSRPAASNTTDSAAIVGTANRFHAALSAGDTSLIKRLLAPDLVVLEAGEVETREQYLAHHLAADIKYAKAVSSITTLTSYTCDGNSAWLVSTTKSRGTFRGRAVNSVGAELMILGRTPRGWQIRAVHWSSSRRESSQSRS